MNDGTLASRSSRERLRLFKDKCFTVTMTIGGFAVILAILLIFFYLLYVVAPLFKGAGITSDGVRQLSRNGVGVLVASDEYAEVGQEISAAGRFRFFELATGRDLGNGAVLQDESTEASVVAAGAPSAQAILAGTADGRVQLAQTHYDVSYPEGSRVITPQLIYSYGDQPLRLTEDGSSLRLITGQVGENEASVAGVSANGQLTLLHLERQTSFLDDEITVNESRAIVDIEGEDVTQLAIDVEQQRLFVVSDATVLSMYDITRKDDPVLLDRTAVVAPGSRVTALALLSGGLSLIIGDDQGRLKQWFPVRDAQNNYALQQARELPAMDSAIALIAPEHFRKGFAALDIGGSIALYHATASRQLVSHAVSLKAPTGMSFAPRADAVVVINAAGDYETFRIDNPHPEVSWQALWGKVWYESREQPEFIWQSSSASAAFEPKFSLTPLTFGTLKASFYSMLFAIPIAVLGAVYTAYFMSPGMRAAVKPSIEIMAALPTVILGFLAGLWLAALVEQYLVGFVLMPLLVPLIVVLSAYLWQRAPARLQNITPDGWEAALLIPVVMFALWASLALGSVIETQALDGSATQWLHDRFGISYDQRNSLVVGLAIGFAVIPTIFTISEDAVFSVPRSLTMGSLALGATPWQTAVRVVLLTASPGIFSAIMIGMGRAVGETMIVLMATGNTPIMDLSIFQGFRALSANIAVEMPESEVDSTHYRILFVAALVLFMATFAVNTLAEVVRQRLRRKYASL